MEEIKDWAKGMGAKQLSASTKAPGLLEQYGFVKDDSVSMILEL